MENEKAQLLERLKSANNVLVTVSSNPSVDQLAGAIGLTLMLNKLGKHATAVFSGKVPSTIEFLQPEKTIEKNTDSLRDFIIALDKSKADKLRYKVEDSHVKIFITPYRTSITDKDLEFSQGDFNVEVVVALGVKEQKDLDKAITAHGRILHDATTASLTNGAPSTLGNINWDNPQASSLCEMVATLADELGQGLLDGQMATALMTGIVAETERFRNAKTTPSTMSLSSVLMAAGANQQLIATKLEEEQVVDLAAKKKSSAQPEGDSTPDASASPAKQDDGSLQIAHEEHAADKKPESQVQIDEDGNLNSPSETPNEPPAPTKSKVEGGGSLILEPPTLGGKLTANAEPENLDPAVDALGVKPDTPLLEHQEKPLDDSGDQEPDVASSDDPVDLPAPSMDLPSDLPPLPAPEPEQPPVEPVEEGAASEPSNDESTDQTLAQLEAAVHNSYDSLPNEPPAVEPAADLPTEPPAPVSDTVPAPDVSDARDAVADALASINQPLEPIQALNAQPFDINSLNSPVPPVEESVPDIDLPTASNDLGIPVDPVLPLPPEPVVPEFTMPDNLVPPPAPIQDPTAAPVSDPTAPPTVPPPFMPNVPGFDPGLPPQLPETPPADDQQPPANPNNPFNLPPA